MIPTNYEFLKINDLVCLENEFEHLKVYGKFTKSALIDIVIIEGKHYKKKKKNYLPIISNEDKLYLLEEEEYLEYIARMI